MLDAPTFSLTEKQNEVRKLFSLAYRYLLVYGGSRSGKTFFIVYAIITRAIKAPGSRHVIFRNDGVDAKQSVGNETIPAVVSLAYPGLSLKWNEKDGYYELPNGSQIWLCGLKDKARLDKALGKEYVTIYLNEASQITLEAFELVKSRLAQVVNQVDGRPLPQRLYVDLNPTTSAHWTYQIFVVGRHPEGKTPISDHKQDYAYIMVNPVDNMDNLSRDYIRSLDNMPERARRRFFEGVYNTDDDNALWRRSQIEFDEPTTVDRIVVAVDPATSTNVGSDETGIVAAGIDAAKRGYVLEDDSGKYKPEQWARKAISLYDTYDADYIVAEANQGGEMVKSTIQAVARGRTIPVKLVHASRGKHVRAEPIAALYEEGKVKHAKPLPDLEDQMCFVAGTLIETRRGQVPIERVVAGDKVMTRAGWRTVEVACETGIVHTVVDIEATDGRTITCTPTHPIFVKGKFVAARSVRASDCLLGSPNWASTDHQSRGAGAGIIGCQADTLGTPRVNCFTGLFGRLTMGLSKMVVTFTTGMRTLAITASQILSASPLRTITAGTHLEAGTRSLKRGPSGVGGLGRCGGYIQSRANTVVGNMKRHIPESRGIARTVADKKRDLQQKLLIVNAPIAGTDLRHAIQGESIVVKRVTTRRTAPVSVYNLQVDGLPEYFANGILAHNCSFTIDFDRKEEGYSPDRVDALVWALTELFPRMVKKTGGSKITHRPRRGFY